MEGGYWCLVAWFETGCGRAAGGSLPGRERGGGVGQRSTGVNPGTRCHSHPYLSVYSNNIGGKIQLSKNNNNNDCLTLLQLLTQTITILININININFDYYWSIFNLSNFDHN